MKRPSPQASSDSWVSIWLGCMGARFSAPGSTTKNTTEHDGRGSGRKHPKSLHQSECGHGYTPRESYQLHPGVRSFNTDSEIGCTPCEYVHRFMS